MSDNAIQTVDPAALAAQTAAQELVIQRYEGWVEKAYNPQWPAAMREFYLMKVRSLDLQRSTLFNAKKWSQPDIFNMLQFVRQIGLSENAIFSQDVYFNQKGIIQLSTRAKYALAQRSGCLKSIKIPTIEEVLREKVAVVIVHSTRQEEPITGTFSFEDAIKAGLMDKATYKGYDADMITKRAQARALEAAFPELYMGVADTIIEDMEGDVVEVGFTEVVDIPSAFISDPIPAEPEAAPESTEEIVDEPPVEPEPQPEPESAPPPPEGKAWATADSLLGVAEQMRDHVKAKCATCSAQEIHTTVIEFIELVGAEKNIAKFDRNEVSLYPLWNAAFPSAQALLAAAKASYDEFGAPEAPAAQPPDWSTTADLTAFEQWSRAMFGLAAHELLERTGKVAFSDLGSSLKVAKETVIMLATTEGSPIPVIVYEAKYDKNHVVYKTLLGKPVRDYGTKPTSGRDRLRAMGPEWATYAEGMGVTFSALPEPVLLTVKFGNTYYQVESLARLQAAPA